MEAEAASKARAMAVFRVVLGLAFLAVGGTKLTGTAQTVEYFAAIRWGQWFRYLTGLLDVTGAALLFVPRWTFYGAVMLTCTVGSATLISLIMLRGDPMWGGWEMTAAPLVLTLLAAALAWVAPTSSV